MVMMVMLFLLHSSRPRSFHAHSHTLVMLDLVSLVHWIWLDQNLLLLHTPQPFCPAHRGQLLLHALPATPTPIQLTPMVAGMWVWPSPRLRLVLRCGRLLLLLAILRLGVWLLVRGGMALMELVMVVVVVMMVSGV